MEFQRLSASKGSRREKRITGPSDPKGCVVEICFLKVKSMQEKQVQRSLELPKPKETKWIVVIKSRRTRVDISCASGGSNLRGSKREDFGTPEARRVEANHSGQFVGGHVSIDCGLLVKVLQEKENVERF
jgi:hypothetical protein